MKRGVHKLTATVRHIGMDVPDSIAYPLALERMLKRRRITAAGCWEWTGFIMPNGYAEMSIRSHSQRVHRLMWLIKHGPIPPDKIVCHTCDNTICFNPDHLELGTHQENIRQSVERGRHHESIKTHCAHGHAFAEHGVIYGGKKKRFCKACAYERYHNPKPRTVRSETHCKHGHEFTEANTYRTPDGRRNCRACHHASVRRWKPKPQSYYEIDASVKSP
jgi:hypothetical protein